MAASASAADRVWMERALRLARRGLGVTSPNPAVGAVLVRGAQLLGEGWHHGAGLPHAEVEAFRDAARRGRSVTGATLFVTLEPCSTHGRTPPCTDAILKAGLRRVVVAAVDPNPAHAGRGLQILRDAGLAVDAGLLADQALKLNESFNHWIVRRTPFVTVKAAMTLDGKIAMPDGASRWITGDQARREGMRLRAAADAIVTGVNTVLADDPQLSIRGIRFPRGTPPKRWRKIVLDTRARTPLNSRLVSGEDSSETVIVVSERAPAARVEALARRVQVWRSPGERDGISLGWLLHELGRQDVTHVLVEGGGRVNAAFLLSGLAQRVAFFYAPKILAAARARKGVAGVGRALDRALHLEDVRWRWLGGDLLMTARLAGR